MDDSPDPARHKNAGGAVLVVGTDGFIGSALIRGLSARGFDCLGTTRRPERVSSRRLYLDLTRQEEFALPKALNSAIIAAGVTGFKNCETKPEAWDVNTVKIPALAARLLEAGVFTLLLSSSAVFAESMIRPAEEAVHNPTTAYGRQKSLGETKAVEKARALDRDGLLCVARLTKILDAGTGLAA
ncbi:MAG: NAD-dependent epimerase/dehydratase family protein, partial [Planctomycetota bacterium]|nr:NAD-dependent epimerase/dehydratase family protein [Planctomycetota bacterium]